MDVLDLKALTMIAKITGVAWCTVGNHYAVSIPGGHNCPICRPFPNGGFMQCRN